MADQPKDVYFERDGVRLHGLEISGGAADGTPVIMLHGGGSNGWGWGAPAPLHQMASATLPHIAKLHQRAGRATATSRPRLRPDRVRPRRAGGSQDALGGKPMVVVGHSRGGWSAAYVAGRGRIGVSHTWSLIDL